MNTIYEELRAALYSIWHRRWLVLAVAWGICMFGWLAVALVPNTYESRARIFVQLDDVLAQQIGIGQGDRRRDIERVRQTLTGAINLEKVVRSTRISDDVTNVRQMETAVAALAKRIEVVSQQDNLFEITATSGDSSLSDNENSKLSRDIVQKMIDIFREENLAGGRGEMRDTITFLDQQLGERQKQLEEAEQRRLAFEAQHPELIGGAQAIAAKLESARSEQRSVDADLAAAQSALAAIDGQLQGTPRVLISQAAPSGATGALMQAEADLSGMRSRGLTENHPDVIAQHRQVAALRRQAQAQGGGGMIGTPNPAYSALQSIRGERQANVQALQARRAAQSSEIASIVANQSMEPGVAGEATRISRDYEVLREQYDKLLQDREELRLRGQVENERSAIKFEVIDPPTSPRVPAAPNRPILLFGVLLLGLAGGLGAGFAIGQLRSTFATAGKLEHALDLPVLGTISHTWDSAGRQLRARRMRMFAAGSAGLFGLFAVLLTIEFVQRGMVA